MDLVLQIVLPFVLSALIVILITTIAEKYGTKVGGIIGTLPTTIIIAYVFIALNQGIVFASDSVAVVPAEMGVNLVFICAFAVLAYRSTVIALFGSFFVWIILSGILLFLNMHYIYLSIIIFTVSMISTFIVLEKKFKIKSQGKRIIHYTPLKILLRGILTGTIITISVLLSNIGEVLSGIFTVFPAILSSTMIITIKEHGPDFSAGIAKSMIFGSPSVMIYAASIHFMYPIHGIFWGSIFSLIMSAIVTLIIFKLRKKIS
jgi:uncharacterized membrane protein (GlpM family)